MALAKLKIKVETAPGKFDQEIDVLFNPNQISIAKTANWRDAPTARRDVPASQHTHADAARLTMELFFDTYERGTDVRLHTAKIAQLMTVEQHGNMHRPPICLLFWGRAGRFFQGVLESLDQRFTLFLEDGWPVRATLGCTFKEWRGDEEEARLQNLQSADVVKTRLLKRGDTLSSLAFEEYHDPALWRPIADANGIVDPFTLPYGRFLVIPTLDARATER